ncbi:MAG: hypothetical protein CMF62_02090 [Magnetococcales bacterium]|nr:hypothetical protein [Magnetococcales bacterium]|tara:strand:+ start:153994 stop:156066 length:2073 start_codon:yes stop_codon:yes gene_type:complete
MDITKFLLVKEKKVKKSKEEKIQDEIIESGKQILGILFGDSIITESQYVYWREFIESSRTLTKITEFEEFLQLQKSEVSSKLINIIKELSPKLLYSNEKIYDDLSAVKKDIITFTEDQKKGILNILNFLKNPKELTFGLYGYAGTGKTTTITETIHYLLKNKFIKSIAFTAPTNKAVNIMKAKFRHNIASLLDVDYNDNLDTQLDQLNQKGIKISFITIHKLLNYESNYSIKGEKVFLKTKKSNINYYDMVIVDECSMIPLQIITHIFEDLREQTLRKSFKIPKVLFVGDPAQLPPVNEKLSIIFSKKDTDFSYRAFKNNMPETDYGDKYYEKVDVKEMIKKRIENLRIEILNQKTFTLKKVMRTNDDNIIKLCFNIRQWVNNLEKPMVKKFKGKKLFLYKKTKETQKNQWLNSCIEKFRDSSILSNSNIVLTWTNKQCDQYNKKIREEIHNKKNLDKYELGDILVLSDFYNFDENPQDKYKKKNIEEKDSRFYTSEQIKVIDIHIIDRTSDKFKNYIEKSAKKIKNSRLLETKYIKVIEKINNLKCSYKCYKLHVQKLIEVKENFMSDSYVIFSMHDNSKEKWELDKMKIMNEISELRKFYKLNFKEQLKQIDEFIIRPLIKEYHRNIVDPFANINYGVSMTVHKSQSSSYYNVFVDVDDIMLNHNENDCKRCIYTAFTRTVNELHLLI